MTNPILDADDSTDTAWASTRDTYVLAIAEAAAAGVPLAVTRHGTDGSERHVVQPSALSVDDGRMTIRDDGGRIEIPLRGADAPAILPDVLPMDAAFDKTANAAAAMTTLRTAFPMIVFDDGHAEVLLRPDLVHVASTGIYPMSGLGADWSEIDRLEATDDALLLHGPRDLALRAA